MCGRYPNVSPSQTWIGSQTFNCRQTANKSVKVLHHLGLISVVGRYRQTSVYKLNPIFGDPEFRAMVSHLIPALKKFSIILYFSFMATLNYRQNINISSLTTLESRFSDVPAPKFLKTTQKEENLKFDNKSLPTLPTSIASVLCRDDAFFHQPTYTPPDFQGYRPMYTTLEQKMYDIKKMTVPREQSLIYKQALGQQRAIDCAPPVKKEPVILTSSKKLAFAAFLQSL
jgi:hypothetical protein